MQHFELRTRCQILVQLCIAKKKHIKYFVCSIHLQSTTSLSNITNSGYGHVSTRTTAHVGPFPGSNVVVVLDITTTTTSLSSCTMERTGSFGHNHHNGTFSGTSTLYDIPIARGLSGRVYLPFEPHARRLEILVGAIGKPSSVASNATTTQQSPRNNKDATATTTSYTPSSFASHE